MAKTRDIKVKPTTVDMKKAMDSFRAQAQAIAAIMKKPIGGLGRSFDGLKFTPNGPKPEHEITIDLRGKAPTFKEAWDEMKKGDPHENEMEPRANPC